MLLFQLPHLVLGASFYLAELPGSVKGSLVL